MGTQIEHGSHHDISTDMRPAFRDVTLPVSVAPLAELEARLKEYEYSHREPSAQGIRVSIEHFEIALPEIYALLGYPVDAEQVASDLEITRRSTAMGERMKQAYTLFSVVNQMVRHGRSIDEIFRGGEETVLAPFRTATADLQIPPKISEESLAALFMAAWKKYPYTPPEGKHNFVLFSGMGFYDPLPAQQARDREDNIIDSGALAHMCARARLNNSLSSWEFRPDAVTYMHVPVVLNTTKGVQFTSMVESMSVKSFTGVGLPGLQYRDLSLGTLTGLDGVAREVRLRQIQTAHRASEYVTGQLERKAAILRKGTALILNDVTLTTRKDENTAEFGRVCISPDGELVCVLDQALTEGRDEFNRWLSWYIHAVRVFGDRLRPKFSARRAKSE